MAVNFNPMQGMPQAFTPGPLPQQFQPQVLPAQAAPQAQANLGQRNDRRGALHDWRALRPQMQPGMDRSQLRTMLQDWRGQRPQFGGQMSMPPYQGGGQDLAARHAAMLQQARPQQAATSGFAAPASGFAPRIAPQAGATQQTRQR